MQTSRSFLLPLISIVLSFTILTLPAYAAYTPTLSDQTCAPGAVAVITSNGLECKLAGDILAQGVTVNSGTLANCSDDELLWTDNGQIKCVNLNCPKTSDPGTHKYLAGFKDGASECLSVPLGSSSNWTVSGSYVIPKNNKSIQAPGYFYSSDRRLKHNITPLEHSVRDLSTLRGYSFSLKDDSEQIIRLGLIAQEVEQVFPEVVHVDTDGYKSVDYASLIPVLIEGIKEITERVDTLSTTVEKQKKEIALLKDLLQ